MSSIREQLKLKQHYADFEALKAEVTELKVRVYSLELASVADLEVVGSDLPGPVVLYKRRGRPPKVRDGN